MGKYFHTFVLCFLSFALGIGLMKLTQPSIGEMILNHAPCELQAVGEPGSPEQLIQWEQAVRQAVIGAGARLLEVQHKDGYAVFVVERCVVNQMEGIGNG